MRPRRWDVGRVAACALATASVLSACGNAQYSAPPSPKFVSGERAEPTVVAGGAGAQWRGEGNEITLTQVEADAAPIDASATEQMTLTDDTGIATPNTSGWARFDEALARRLVPANVSASVAVMIDGQLVHAGAYGVRVADGNDAVETTDRFRIASISKTITAITALRLVEQGVLSLDEPIGDIVVEHLGLTSPDADVSSTTLRELLSHTAGFPQHEGTFFSNGATSCIDAATQGLSSSVASGNGFRYSNMSYCVLGVLIEAVTGKTYERVVDEQLLTPLGISGMRFTSTYELGPDEVSHHPSPNRNFMEALGAAGAWNATPSDLVAILNSIDPTTPGWKALSGEMMATLRHRVPTGLEPSGYGLGVINYDGGAWGHTGTLQNTHAMVLSEAGGLTWAVTVSGEFPSNTGRLRSIVASAIRDAFPPN